MVCVCVCVCVLESVSSLYWSLLKKLRNNPGIPQREIGRSPLQDVDQRVTTDTEKRHHSHFRAELLITNLNNLNCS